MKKSTWWKASIAIAAFFVLWWLIAKISNNNYFPTPWDTAKAFWELLITPKTYTHIWLTCHRAVIGLLLGSFVGIVLGISTKYSEFMDTIVRVIIYPLFQSFPPICWALVFVLWFGLSNITPILTIMTVVAPFFMINIWEGMKDIDETLIEMASTYTNKRFRILTKIILPMLYPYFFDASKSGVTTAWKAVILGELYGSIAGMGYMLNMSFKAYHMSQVFAWTMFFVIILVIFDKVIFNFIERKFVRKWKTVKAF